MVKRGQELSITTLILIVIGIVVLVLIVIGFTGGFGTLADKFTNLGGGSNVQSVLQACTIACNTQAVYDYCQLKRTVNFGADTTIPEAKANKGKLTLTCGELEKDDKSKQFNTGLSCSPSPCSST